MSRENSFTHNVGTGGDGSGLVCCFAGRGGRGDLGEPESHGSGIKVYDGLGECASKRNLSMQGVESPNFEEFRWMSIAVEALLHGSPGVSEPPDEAVERLASRGTDTGIEPEQEKRERAVALAKAVGTAVCKLRCRMFCWPGVGRGFKRSWTGNGTLFGAAFEATRLPVSSR